MKIIYNPIIPFKGFLAVNLFGVLFIRSNYKGKISERIITHETIHTKQMREMLYVFFYLWYIVEWLVRLCLTGDMYKAYRTISFERESSMFEGCPEYPKIRTHFNWIQFL